MCWCNGGSDYFYDTNSEICTTEAECKSKYNFILRLDDEKQCVSASTCKSKTYGLLDKNYYAYDGLGECIKENPISFIERDELGIRNYPKEIYEDSDIYACATGQLLVVNDQHKITYCASSCMYTNSTFLYAPGNVCFSAAQCTKREKYLYRGDAYLCVDECPDDSPAYSTTDRSCTTCEQL